jgi:hypothetical protein
LFVLEAAAPFVDIEARRMLISQRYQGRFQGRGTAENVIRILFPDGRKLGGIGALGPGQCPELARDSRRGLELKRLDDEVA